MPDILDLILLATALLFGVEASNRINESSETKIVGRLIGILIAGVIFWICRTIFERIA